MTGLRPEPSCEYAAEDLVVGDDASDRFHVALQAAGIAHTNQALSNRSMTA
jgi:hypothetical protein